MSVLKKNITTFKNYVQNIKRNSFACLQKGAVQLTKLSHHFQELLLNMTLCVLEHTFVLTMEVHLQNCR